MSFVQAKRLPPKTRRKEARGYRMREDGMFAEFSYGFSSVATGCTVNIYFWRTFCVRIHPYSDFSWIPLSIVF